MKALFTFVFWFLVMIGGLSLMICSLCGLSSLVIPIAMFSPAVLGGLLFGMAFSNRHH